jgi:hypothetical protein
VALRPSGTCRHRLDASVLNLKCRIRPPGPPSFLRGGERVAVAPQGTEGLGAAGRLRPGTRRGHGIPASRCSRLHGLVFQDCKQMFACRARVGAWVDDNLAGRQPGGERSQGVATRARSREGVGVGVCQGRCGREQVRHSADELLQRRSQRASQIRQVCLHDSPREVLLERRTQGELLARDAARNAYPRGVRGRAGRASDPRRVPRRRRAGRRRGRGGVGSARRRRPGHEGCRGGVGT